MIMISVNNNAISNLGQIQRTSPDQQLVSKLLDKNSTKGISPELSLSANDKIADKVISFNLEEGLKKSGFIKPEQSVETKEALFDFEAVAKTVMEFVSSTINKAKERGDSDEQIAYMFEQAEAGINLGLDQALDELKELEQLNDVISTGVGKSRTLITDQLGELFKKFFPDESASIESNNEVEERVE